MLILSKREALCWRAIEALEGQAEELEAPIPSAMPAQIVGISLAVCAATLFLLIPLNDRNQGMLAGFASALLLLSALMLGLARRMR